MKSKTLILATAAALFLTAATDRLLAQAVNFHNRQGKVAFVSGVDIYIVRPDGTDLKQLTNFGSSGGAAQPSWSADGEEIVFSFFPSTGPGEIWEMDRDGGNLHRLHHEAAFSNVNPHLSPDGRNVVFSRCSSIQCAIYRIQSDGTGLTALTHFSSNPDVGDFQPSYSPDGSTIAFGSYIRGGLLSAVYVMNADGSNIRPLTPPENLAIMPAWSADGHSIAFTANGFYSQVLDEEIWRINVDGSELIQLTNNNQNWNGYFSGPHDYWPSWSPHGDAIVFEEDAPDFSTATIYIMNADGSGQRAVYTAQLPKKAAAVRERVGRGAVSAKYQGLLRLLENNAVSPSWGPASE